MASRTTWIAILIGMAGASLIWILQPLNNYLLNNSFVADNYLPELVVGIMAVIVLAINPLLRFLIGGAKTLSMRQLALIFAILLVATTPLSLLRVWPHSLARGNRDIAASQKLAALHADMDLPDSLYLEPVGYGEDTPVSSQLVDELEPGNRIPWAAWGRPLLGWGSMIAFSWLLMLGLVLAIFPQWRDNERLSFPLLTVQQELIQPPGEGHVLPRLFRSRIFWTGFIIVAIVHGFNGLNHHTRHAFPPFKCNWQLYGVFSQGLWRHMSWYMKRNQVIFSLVGLTYFVPKRVSFSLWFTVIAYQLYRMFGYEYQAPFYAGTSTDHRNGAILGVACIILWLGRAQWRAVFRAMFRIHATDVDRRNRTAGYMLCTGCLGLLAWHLWAGNSLLFAMASAAMVFITSLVLARIVAETGIPFVANYLGMSYFMAMMPVGWLSATTLYLTHMADLVIREGSSRVSLVIPAMHGLGLDRTQTPRQDARMARGFMGIVLLGLLIGGAVHLWMGYHYPGSLDNLRVPIASWGSNNINWQVHDPLLAFGRGSWGGVPYNQPAHLLLGFFVGAGLQIGCLASPLWPLHPVGLLMVDTWFLAVAWPSIFLGWAGKSLVTRYGGAQLYRLLKPLFLGLVIGEVFSAVLWALIPVILIALGENPADVGHILIAPQ